MHLNKTRKISTLLLALYLSTYIALRLTGIIIHGIHDRHHFVAYYRANLGPVFYPLIKCEEVLHTLLTPIS